MYLVICLVQNKISTEDEFCKVTEEELWELEKYYIKSLKQLILEDIGKSLKWRFLHVSLGVGLQFTSLV